MSNINNDLFFEYVINVNVILWMIYYKQQIVKNQKKIINFEIKIVERQIVERQIVERQIVERRKFVISTFSFVFVEKFFIMKIINVTFNNRKKKTIKNEKNIANK